MTASDRTRVFLVRHGATLLTAEDRFAGSTDVALSEDGRGQVRRLARRLEREALAAVYATLLGQEAVDASPNFVMFAFDSGFMLGLWARHDVDPVALPAGGGELTISLDDNTAVDAAFAQWTQRGIAMAQAPVTKDFGYTFVALDPDGHRLRVLTAAKATV